MAVSHRLRRRSLLHPTHVARNPPVHDDTTNVRRARVSAGNPPWLARLPGHHPARSNLNDVDARAGKRGLLTARASATCRPSFLS